MKPPPQQLEPLTVALRVRPMNQTEYRNGHRQIAHTVDENLVVLMDPFEDADDILRANRSREKKFYFDMTFGPQSTQRDVYQYAVVEKNIIGSIIGGYNCTVFAYGATGAGKTYTMLGTETDPGIMALTLNDLFQKIEDTKEDMIYRVTMAYLEIYNEMIRDLLCPSNEVLELFEDSTGEIVVNNLVEVETTSTSEVMKLLQRGNRQRTCEPTAANKTSSRSHAILKVTVEQRSRVMDVSQDVRTGVLFMVDLAGSERARVTKNRGKRFVEGAHINRSLLALANCINALSSSNTNYVNYRDSKLTRLLRDALGGNCKTVMIAHVSPSCQSFEESRNTLSYAEIGKKIKNRTRQNVTEVKYHITQYHSIIKELQTKVNYLQSQLARQASGVGGGRGVGGARKESSEVHSLCQQLKEFIQEEKEIRQELLSLEYKLLQNAMECQKHLGRINEWEQKNTSREVCSTLDPIPQSSSILEDTIPSSAETMVEQVLEVPCGVSMETHLNDPSHQEEPSATVSLGVEQKPSVVHMSISPDSGTAELSVSQVEPFSVASSKEELSTLVADKQRMEAQHRRLERKVKESKSKVLEINEKLSSYPDLLPVQRDLIELLQHSYELEASNIEHHLTSALMSIQIANHESMIETLLKHSEQLLGVIELQRELMEEQLVPLPEDLSAQCQELSDRQKSLQLQVTGGKKPPLLGRELHVKLPNIARLSARLYPTMTASKSNLFVRDDTPTEVEGTSKDLSPLAISDIRLPSLSSLETQLSPAPLVQNDSDISLPPIDTTKQPSLVAVKPDSLPDNSQSPEPYPANDTKQPDISLIVEAARKARLQKSDTKLQLASGKSALPSPKKILSKVPSFTGPRISISRCSARTKRKYIVSQRPKVHRTNNTVVFDCESDDNRSLPDQPELRKRDSIASLASKSQSQPLLSPKHISKQSHKRARTLPFSRPVLSNATRHSSKHREGRKVITLEELDKIYRQPLKKTTSSTHSTPIHKTVSSSHSRKPAESTSTTPLHKAGFKSKQTPVHKATNSGLLVHSTHTSKPHPFISRKDTVAHKRRLPLAPAVKRHIPLRRRELALAKVNASSHFSSVSSPYRTPLRQPKKQGKGHATKSEKK